MSPEVPVIIFVIAIPMYFISKVSLKKLRIGSQDNRKYIAIIPTIILSPLIYIATIVIWIFSISYYPNTKFDKKEWNINIEQRYKMSDDIIKSQMLIGKTKEDVIELLGNNYYTYSENHIAYELGHVPFLFNIDPDFLNIYFENGTVVKVDQHEG